MVDPGNLLQMSPSKDLGPSTRQALDALPATYTDEEVRLFTEDRLRAREMNAGSPPSVMFVCVHNAGRSQMSAGWARHLAGERLVVFSGGSAPGPEVNPVAIEAMAEVGIDISDQFPKPLTDDIVEASNVVVTMGCGDECPYFPGKRYIDWELPDPHGEGLELIRTVRDDIEVRVRALISELLPGDS